MTMDVRERERGRDREREMETSLPSVKSAGKRSFDVAFLMAPDDLSKRRQHRLRLVTAAALMQPRPTTLRHHELLRSPPTRGPEDEDEESEIAAEEVIEEEGLALPRSAFTKVLSSEATSVSPAPRLDLLQPTSPSSVSSGGGGLSPDVTYQESLSPPAGGRSPPYLRPASFLQVPYLVGGKPPLMAPEGSASPSSPPVERHLHTHPQIHQHGQWPYPSRSPVDKAPVRQRSLSLYQTGEGLPYGGLTVATAYPFPAAAAGVPSHPLLTAAANVTAALLPPSLAALSLPAQNVCAKCNVSFRMTSDLVYHMRSHHKSETTHSEAARRRREQEKLKCPVCNESFRERHHLTRHMTAHQDKEGDDRDVEDRPTTK